MSDLKLYICAAFPDPASEVSDGAVKVARCIEAKNAEIARAKCSLTFLEEYDGAQDAAYKFMVCEATPDMPLPSVGSWDESYFVENDWSEELGHPVTRKVAMIDYSKLAVAVRIAVLVKYDNPDIPMSALQAAIELTQDGAGTFEGHIVEAISKTPDIANMHPERITHAIGWLKAKCAPTDKWPEIQKELTNWKKRQDGERKQTGSSKSVVDIARQKATEKKPTPVLLQDEDSLKRNIALGLVARAMDFNILNPPASIVNRARDIIKVKQRPFTQWLETMMKTQGIFEYSTVQIIYSVKVSPADLDKTPGAIQGHINRTFTETDHANPSAAMMAAACGDPENNEGKNDEAQQNPQSAAHTLDASTSTTGAMEPQQHDADSTAGTLETSSQVRNGPFYYREVNGDSYGKIGDYDALLEQLEDGKYIEINEAEYLVLSTPEEQTPERTGPFYFLFANGEKVGRANKIAGLQKALADGCSEISQEEYQARKNGTYTDAEANPATNEPASEQNQQQQNDEPTHDDVSRMLAEQRGGYVEGISDPNDPRWVPGKPAAVEEETKPGPDLSFIARADALEDELSETENLSLWRSVMRTNPRYTKDMGDLGFGGTSINASYMIMRATEMFGPVGIGWGWKILEDQMLEGGPLTEKVFEGTKFVGKRTLRDADGTLIYELNHRLKVEVWFLKDGQRGSVENYGSTPYRQTTKNGIYCDSEVHKKSLTDAIKKCLSSLGFSADVWMGHFDDAEYVAESKLEFDIKGASEKADDTTRIREELDERFKGNVETMRNAVSQNEVSKIASSLTRTIGIYLKSAKEIGDVEYTKYLEGRLRRLEEVKTECLKTLEEKA